jgi:hypothetical protein
VSGEEGCAGQRWRTWRAMNFRVHGNEPVILRGLRCLILLAVEVFYVKRLVPRLLLLSPSTIKPERPFDPKLQCTVRHEGPEYTPIEIPHTRSLLVRRPGKLWLPYPELCGGGGSSNS